MVFVSIFAEALQSMLLADDKFQGHICTCNNDAQYRCFAGTGEDFGCKHLNQEVHAVQANLVGTLGDDQISPGVVLPRPRLNNMNQLNASAILLSKSPPQY